MWSAAQIASQQRSYIFITSTKTASVLFSKLDSLDFNSYPAGCPRFRDNESLVSCQNIETQSFFFTVVHIVLAEQRFSH